MQVVEEEVVTTVPVVEVDQVVVDQLKPFLAMVKMVLEVEVEHLTLLTPLVVVVMVEMVLPYSGG
jgi:hypothetical protein